MSRTHRFTRWAGTRASRRLLRSIPYLGALVALAYLGDAMRRKGPVPGALDSALDAIPYVGATKILAETVRGRDFIPERPPGRRPGGLRERGKPPAS
jgi:hypothetical protein